MPSIKGLEKLTISLALLAISLVLVLRDQLAPAIIIIIAVASAWGINVIRNHHQPPH